MAGVQIGGGKRVFERDCKREAGRVAQVGLGAVEQLFEERTLSHSLLRVPRGHPCSQDEMWRRNACLHA